jgi:hypothetical protein
MLSEIIYLADWAAQARATHHANDRAPAEDNVIKLRRDSDAA